MDTERLALAHQRAIKRAELTHVMDRIAFDNDPRVDPAVSLVAMLLDTVPGVDVVAKVPTVAPWNGLCPRGVHGLDYAGQPCDLCTKDRS